MIYNKPVIDVVGMAVRVIEGGKVFESLDDGLPPAGHPLPTPPAYALDE